MRVEPHAHLPSLDLGSPGPSRLVADLRHTAFGPGRFARQCHVHHTHACDRLRVAPAACGPRKIEVIRPDVSIVHPGPAPDGDQPRPWPFDTPLPRGLPELPIQPGYLPHVFAPGSALGYGGAADNVSPPPTPPAPASWGSAPTDAIGTLLDIWG